MQHYCFLSLAVLVLFYTVAWADAAISQRREEREARAPKEGHSA